MDVVKSNTLKQRVLNVREKLPRYGYVPKVVQWLKENGHTELANDPRIAIKVYSVSALRLDNEPITQALEAIAIK
jgi:hypothetical protein